MLSDPIADFLTRIRNAKKERHRYVDAPLSKEKLAIAKILQARGFIADFIINEEKKVLRLFLKYDMYRASVFNNLKRISKPGLRRYIGYREIPKILGGMGLAILSTNQGILDGEIARAQKLGGEILCYIW